MGLDEPEMDGRMRSMERGLERIGGWGARDEYMGNECDVMCVCVCVCKCVCVCVCVRGMFPPGPGRPRVVRAHAREIARIRLPKRCPL